jgi:hypothetical protein
VVEARDHTGNAAGASCIFLPPPDGCSTRGENPGSEHHSLVQARKSSQGTHGRLIIDGRHGAADQQSRCNDSADIVPPQLCSTPASSAGKTNLPPPSGGGGGGLVAGRMANSFVIGTAVINAHTRPPLLRRWLYRSTTNRVGCPSRHRGRDTVSRRHRDRDLSSRPPGTRPHVPVRHDWGSDAVHSSRDRWRIGLNPT